MRRYLTYIVDTKAVDDQVTQEPGHEQPWYRYDGIGIIRVERIKACAHNDVIIS